MEDIVVFSGSAHRELAANICRCARVDLSPVGISRFSNDCLQAQLLVNVRQRDVYIVQPLVPPTQDHLMELLLMVQAAKSASAAQVTAVIPHYSYARSDKKDASRISVGGRLVADLLVTAGVDRVLTMQLHSPQVQAFFSVPVDQLTALGVIADHYRGACEDAVVVSPDFGNAKSASNFARLPTACTVAPTTGSPCMSITVPAVRIFLRSFFSAPAFTEMTIVAGSTSRYSNPRSPRISFSTEATVTSLRSSVTGLPPSSVASR